MFTVEMLPAQRGDCLWITYGPAGDPHHVLVDAGPQDTIPTLVPELERRISALPGTTNRLELLVVTHVDADHIQGVVSLLSDERRVRLFRDVWFNGFQHLAPHMLGGPDGERLTRVLLANPGRWNAAFDGGPVALPDAVPPAVVRLRGGLELTVLGPRPATLARLAPEWAEACRKAGILPGQGAEITRRSWVRDGLLGFDVDALARAPYRKDSSKANATSITLVATYEGKRVLLLGDAPAEEVVAGLDRLGPGPHEFAAVKMSHHGSRRNTSPALLERVRSRTWLVSTDGAVFGHPDAEALARVVTTQRRPTFVLNHVTDTVSDLVAGAGDRWTVRLPRRRRDGTYAAGIRYRVA
jgi:beta-lactamase superfamily II metal-dependent hydrolase